MQVIKSSLKSTVTTPLKAMPLLTITNSVRLFRKKRFWKDALDTDSYVSSLKEVISTDPVAYSKLHISSVSPLLVGTSLMEHTFMNTTPDGSIKSNMRSNNEAECLELLVSCK